MLHHFEVYMFCKSLEFHWNSLTLLSWITSLWKQWNQETLFEKALGSRTRTNGCKLSCLLYQVCLQSNICWNSSDLKNYQTHKTLNSKICVHILSWHSFFWRKVSRYTSSLPFPWYLWLWFVWDGMILVGFKKSSISSIYWCILNCALIYIVGRLWNRWNSVV